MWNRSLCWLALCLVWCSLPSAGQAADQPPIVTLTLHPAAEPKPALKYQLSTTFLDRQPGNAAVFYNKTALIWAERSDRKELSERIYKLLELPVSDLPAQVADVRKALEQVQAILDDLDLAARRQECDWELPLRERNFVTLVLPEIQQMREFARMVSLRTRLRIVEGRYDDAVRSLATGYTLGRHVAKGPTLINGLVGIAVCQIMSQDLQTLMQCPGAPNLYWALSWLPRPLIDLQPAIETEAHILALSYPELQNLNRPGHSPEYWREFLDRLLEKDLPAFGLAPPEVGWRGACTLLAIRGYPIARDHLIAQGRTLAQVEAMPVAEVVLQYTVDTYSELRDDTFKWFAVPYSEARAGLARMDERLRTEGRDREILPLASMLLPAVGSASLAAARSDRTLALLRTFEALRMHAVANNGQLPDKLSDVTVVAVPTDPLHGKPFQYQKRGATATLESPAPPNGPAVFGLRFEIKMEAKEQKP